MGQGSVGDDSALASMPDHGSLWCYPTRGELGLIVAQALRWVSIGQPNCQPLAEAGVGKVTPGPMPALQLADEALSDAERRGDVSLG